MTTVNLKIQDGLQDAHPGETCSLCRQQAEYRLEARRAAWFACDAHLDDMAGRIVRMMVR